MEHCEHSDLDALYDAQYKTPRRAVRSMIPEEHLWRLFLYMAKAISILQDSSETPGLVDASWGRLVHGFEASRNVTDTD